MISGSLREVVVVEEPVEVANDLGEKELLWRSFRGATGDTYRAAVRQTSGAESSQRGGVATYAAFEVRTRPIPGLANTMRLRWKSRGDRVLYVQSIVEEGTVVKSLRIDCEERTK
jgi:head-tail adaptor